MTCEICGEKFRVSAARAASGKLFFCGECRGSRWSWERMNQTIELLKKQDRDHAKAK